MDNGSSFGEIFGSIVFLVGLFLLWRHSRKRKKEDVELPSMLDSDDDGSPEPDYDAEIASLHRQATVLAGDKDIDGAVECLREAESIRLLSTLDYSVGHHLRLPLYLQKAGRWLESKAEFLRLLNERMHPMDRQVIRKKLELARKREEKNSGTPTSVDDVVPDLSDSELCLEIRRRKREGYEDSFLDYRPYIQIFGVGDKREHPDCAKLDGVVAHGMSKWAKGHWPPHREDCRCTIIKLSKEDLKRKSLTVRHGL